ncbi:MAG: 2Fe-2S iron-sulfur cluster-binding protein, partial [Chitinivibrionales bacterium]|nr:2Fe-2S iron-sulfur cluster-binding protein [Chitinivibrionales bacterium]
MSSPNPHAAGPAVTMHAVTFLPQGQMVQVPDGASLLQAAALANIATGSLCGGEGICGRCLMIVRQGEVVSESFNKLTRQQIQEGYVLGCLSYVKSDAVVEIPAEMLTKAPAAQNDEKRFRDFQSAASPVNLRFDPLVQKVYLELEKPTLANNVPDHQRLCTLIRKKLKVASTQTGLKVIKSLPRLLRENDFKVTATVGIRADIAEVMDVDPGNTARDN